MVAEKKFGVTLALVDESIMSKAIVKEGIEVPDNAGKPEMVECLIKHFRKNHVPEKLAKCDCGGVFPAAFAECPYCGDIDGDANEDYKGKPEVVKPDPKAKKKEPEVKPEPEPEVKPEAETKKPKEPKEPKPEVVDVKPEPEPEVKPEAKTKKPKEPKPEVKAPEAAEKKPVAEIVVAAKDPLAGLSSRDLDDATAEVLRLKGNSSFSMWELGCKLREIHERQLWKLRMSDDGKPRYKSFESYCSEEVRMSGTACYSMIKIAEHYTAEQVRALGTSKLNLILKAPEEDREELERRAAGGESKEALRKQVAKLREEKGAPPPRPAKVARGGAPPVGKSRKSEHMTIATVLGKKAIQVHRKPAKKGDPLEAAVAPQAVIDWIASTLPFGVDDLGNGVRELIAIAVDSKGRLQFKIDRKRMDEE